MKNYMDQKYTADIIIIGGGVIGCSTAYNLGNQGAIEKHFFKFL